MKVNMPDCFVAWCELCSAPNALDLESQNSLEFDSYDDDERAITDALARVTQQHVEALARRIKLGKLLASQVPALDLTAANITCHNCTPTHVCYGCC